MRLVYTSLWVGVMDLFLEIITIMGPLLFFCSLVGNDLDQPAKDAIKSVWGDRGGNLQL